MNKTKKYRISVMLICLVFMISLAILVYAQEPSGTPSDDNNPEGIAEVIIPDQYLPQLGILANEVAGTPVYFTPQDNNSNTTVLFLYNTSSVSATIAIETFDLSGTPIINTSILVPPNNLVRICGDLVDPAAGSWSEAILINFRDNSTYARMTLPEGVKAEGYVVWNNGNTYDPNLVAPTLPLRFSVDPPTMFLPAVQNN